MVRVEHITKEWNEAGSLPAQLNLYGFWDEHAFLTKSGDLGLALKIGGIDYESLDHAGRDYAVKRLEAALRSLDDKSRLYQILFKRNRPAIPYAEYQNPLVRAAQEQRGAFLASKANRLYSIDIFWIITVDGSYQKTGLLHALAQLPRQPRSSLRDLRALFSDNKELSGENLSSILPPPGSRDVFLLKRRRASNAGLAARDSRRLQPSNSERGAAEKRWLGFVTI